MHNRWRSLREVPAECVVETRPRAKLQRPVFEPRPRRYAESRPAAVDESLAKNDERPAGERASR